MLPAKTDAQTRRDPAADGSLGWSVVDRIGYQEDVNYILPASVRSPFVRRKKTLNIGCITGGFMLSLSRGWSIGFAISYARLEEPGTAQFARQGFSFPGGHIFSRLILAAEARKVYFSRNGIRGYGRIGIGGAQRNYDFEYESGGRNSNDDRSVIVAHISPIGISVGQRLRGFAEVGYGYRGLVSLGMAIRF